MIRPPSHYNPPPKFGLRHPLWRWLPAAQFAEWTRVDYCDTEGNLFPMKISPETWKRAVDALHNAAIEDNTRKYNERNDFEPPDAGTP